MLAAQTDFTEAGELTLFINESQVAFLEDMMWERGVLDTTQMAGAFQLLRSNDLIWSRLTRDYLMGERAPPNDLMAWNADATRLPYRMHSEYLRGLFLDNDLAEGRYLVEGGRSRCRTSARRCSWSARVHDHVAPWKSTYKIHYLADADVTYRSDQRRSQCRHRGAARANRDTAIRSGPRPPTPPISARTNG